MKRIIQSLLPFAVLAAITVSCAQNSKSTDESAPVEHQFRGGKETAAAPASMDMEGGNAYAVDGKDLQDRLATDSIAVPDVTTAEGFLSSSAATPSRDTAKKFIRTSEMRYEVKNVRGATLHAEAVTTHFGGWVTHTNLRSEVTQSHISPVSEDSSLEDKHYTVINDMVLRIPAENLDTTIKVLSTQIEYLDFRVIAAEDISIQLMYEALRQQRNERFDRRIGKLVDEKGNKLSAITDAEERRLTAQAAADDALMSRLQKMDQVRYSTINLHIYQRENVRRTMIPNYKNIDAYRPGFFSRIGKGLEAGWDAILTVIVNLFYFWPLWVIVAIGMVVWRVIRRRRAAK